jgi:hypothetical protein
VTNNPMKMSHDALMAHRDKDWADDPKDDPIMRQLCATMRECSPEEYRQHLIRGLVNQPKKRKS